MHRLWRVRAGVPGKGHLRRGRDAGSVEELHRAQQTVLQGPSGSEAGNEVLTRAEAPSIVGPSRSRGPFVFVHLAQHAGQRRRLAPRVDMDFRVRAAWHARRILRRGMNALPDPPARDEGLGYHGAVSDFKRRLIEATLQQARGNRTHAARSLGLQRTYLLRLIRELRVAAPPPPGRNGRGPDAAAPSPAVADSARPLPPPDGRPAAASPALHPPGLPLARTGSRAREARRHPGRTARRA